MQEDQDTKVDRSRLTLLLGLTSTAAAAGCGGTPTSQRRDPYSTFNRRNTDAVDDERPGGEGEGGGGGSH
ncbi:MAG: hypothetical protein U1A06_17695 [Hoeflea sp.]|uniref:hypothetical protein n=1 Tax=Hoeflea sp. TaxID=1940281 RepID=UPI0027313BE2|nr:hypothetical protein [Hoeflea sp.]MDP2118809.1 hypothetical protein [Hoeflea sp.]MDZ7603202.1 hypothetical protein [Hoeflea sp.]